MGTKVKTAFEAAGVTCPKKTGEMDEDESCRKCLYWVKCMSTVMGVLEDGD